MKTAMTPDIVELLAGHAGYLTSSYRRYPKDQVRKEYLAAEYAVSLSGPNEQVRANEETIKMLTTKIVKQEQITDRLLQVVGIIENLEKTDK